MATICRKWGLWIYRFREFIAQQASSRLILTHETRLMQMNAQLVENSKERDKIDQDESVFLSASAIKFIFSVSEGMKSFFFSFLEIYRVILT